ncbi:MAG: hypothetical protein ACRD96_28655 [Bryobacteraceae bacterium]
MRRLLQAAIALSALWAAPPDGASLSGPEKRVLEYLRADWTKQYRTTSVAVAAETIKVKLSDDGRLRLLRFLESHRGEFVAPARHGTTTVILTPEEKLIARALLLEETGHGGTAMALSVPGVKQRLDFLRRAGVVVREGGRQRVAARFPRRPSPRIDFYSHRVEVNGRDPFEVA